jgi:hypothetical protein
MTAPTLDKEDLELLIGVYEQKKQDIGIQIDELTFKLMGAQKELQVYEGKLVSLKRQRDEQYGATADQPYPDGATWNERIKYVLRLLGKPATTSDIVDMMVKLQPASDRAKTMTSVSATISAAIEKLYTKDNENRIALK